MKKIIISLLLTVSSLTYAQSSNGAWGLYDIDQIRYKSAHNIEDVRSIASITKLFTAMTILRSGLELDERVKVQGQSGGRFSRGQMVARRDLMKAMLISSDNLAAETLANTYPGGMTAFLADTNEWVRGFGMVNTRIADASGLLAENTSSINDLTYFILKVGHNQELRQLSSEAKSSVSVKRGKKTITIPLTNTNPLILQYDNILISKTGTTRAAGKCVLMLIQNDGRSYVIAVLGQANSSERNKVAQYLIALLPITKAQANQEYSKGF
jgi:D-alanyl-D-alanine carboxypeptidase